MTQETNALFSGQLYFTCCPKTGDVVLRDCYDSFGGLLAPAGAVLTSLQVDNLLQHTSIPPFLSAAGLDAASASALALYGSRFCDERAAVFNLLDNVISNPGTTTGDVVLDSLPSGAIPLPWLMRLASLDTTTQGHSLNVALLVGAITKRLEYFNVEQSMVCALLHDIGKLRLERDILEARRSLTALEYAHIKTHSQLGYDMLKGRGGILESAALASLRHHVKQPGNGGYPEYISVSELDDIDLIIQFCDIFDALVSRRPYKEIIPPFHALRTVYRDFEEKIETRIATKCVSILQEGFIGSEVVMLDGSYGTLVGVYGCNPVGSPVVRLRKNKNTITGDGTPTTEPIRIIGAI